MAVILRDKWDTSNRWDNF